MAWDPGRLPTECLAWGWIVLARLCFRDTRVRYLDLAHVGQCFSGMCGLYFQQLMV